jgi:uncharacterized membrane protein (DUF2068 family)
MGRKIALILSLALLLFTGCVGLYNSLTEWREGGTTMQQSVTAGVFLYGVLGLVTALGLFRRRRWSVGTAIAWGLAVTYVPGVAVMAYGGEYAILSSAIAASTGSLLVALAVVWTAHVMTRGQVPIASGGR